MSETLISPLTIEFVRGASLSDRERAHIVAFCTRAYEEDMASFFSIFVGATYVLGHCDGVLASHAL